MKLSARLFYLYVIKNHSNKLILFSMLFINFISGNSKYCMNSYFTYIESQKLLEY